MTDNDGANVRVYKSPLHSKAQRAVREKFLHKLGIGQDERQIRPLVASYFQRAKASGQRAAGDKKNRGYMHEFLADAAALHLLASEPRSRAVRLMRHLQSQPPRTNKYQDTTLLAQILKTLGPYPHDGRRIVHEDAVVLEYLSCVGYTPDEIPSYLGKRGQSRYRTYRVAQDFFLANRCPRKRQLTIGPDINKQLAGPKPGRRVLGLLDETEAGFELIAGSADRTIIHEATKLINRLIRQKRMGRRPNSGGEAKT